MVHTCPRCDLRFRSDAEVKAHLSADHGVSTEELDPYHYRGSRTAEPLYGEVDEPPPGTKRYLVVANQTLGGDALLDEIRARSAAESASFHLVVPAQAGAERVRWRLDKELARLRDAGIDADGEVGAPDAADAVGEMLRRRHFDGVILSTLPPGLSQWLTVDMPARIQHRFGVPVTTVVARS